jgi:small subunit ribosomal protein S9
MAKEAEEKKEKASTEKKVAAKKPAEKKTAAKKPAAKKVEEKKAPEKKVTLKKKADVEEKAAAEKEAVVKAAPEKATAEKAAPQKAAEEKAATPVAKSVPKKERPKAKPKVVAKKIAMKVKDDAIYATGRRKESTAKVWVFKGTGTIKVNHVDPIEHLSSERLVTRLLTPLRVLNLEGKYDVRIDINGGGLTGQAEAAMLGLARVALQISEEFRGTLREHGLLTQDRREKERKKYGKRGARKSPQFRKR